MNTNPIGVFDSGIGGLTVFSKLVKHLPNENYIYFGDTKNLPYGTKTKDELILITKDIFDYFASKKVKAVVMACNTTSALTYDALKNNYDFEIYPIIQTAANCIAKKSIKKLGVFSTQATASSHAYRTEIAKHNPSIEVMEMGCPGWVQIVEDKTQEEISSIELVKKYFNELIRFNPDKIILGCTHYPYLLEILEKLAPKELFIDPAEFFVEYIKSDLSSKKLLSTKTSLSTNFVVSAEAKNFQKAAKLFYNIPTLPKVVTLQTHVL